MVKKTDGLTGTVTLRVACLVLHSFFFFSCHGTRTKTPTARFTEMVRTKEWKKAAQNVFGGSLRSSNDESRVRTYSAP